MFVIQGALANTNGSASSRELLEHLKENTFDIDFYQLTPKPGNITAAAFDWQAIVGTTSAIIGIGQALWLAYKKFISPLREKNKSAFLYIQIKTESQKYVNFTINDENYKDGAQFVQEFTKEIQTISMISDSQEVLGDINEIIKSDIWKKI
ncbi:hypothetical protein P4H27_08085 [Paenibacillus taichungensis]|uniref:hypothetical protein n=1 Tax=Paenibacillus taichungensis TaxID=484184 RepID=UPI002DBE50CB|nr:hypothetical protein [Paenibacillus taichungensis]MEC0106895.1 hypothetical protein [Paenibacillus taichungensis]MEC0195175.1 hypothetical protein [Paenibacillus taichungensis]